MTETELLHECMKIAPEYGARLFRNNVGVLEWTAGRRLKYGLCTGSSDLIGWTNAGRFLAVECKVSNRQLTREQCNFLDQVNNAGGLALVVWSVDDFRKAMRTMQDEAKEKQVVLLPGMPNGI